MASVNSFHAGGEPGGSSYLTSPIFGIAKTYQNANEQGGSKAASAGGLFMRLRQYGSATKFEPRGT
jgi:hypothetical protein